LGAGAYRFLHGSTDIKVVDTRRAMVSLPGQEILTQDNISVKLSLCGFYEIKDPVKAHHATQNYQTEFYSHAQVALRDIVAGYTLDDLLSKKNEIDSLLLAKVAPASEALGLAVSTLSVRDVMLPASVKKAFSGIMEARKDAQKQLEKARGEQAVLRNLANASSMFDGNPMLLQARIIQSLSGGSNTIIFNAPGQDPAPQKKAS
jgi:regulator of protease activity HflC (stomatin/prohibitin superfamily)